jgi:integrase
VLVPEFHALLCFDQLARAQDPGVGGRRASFLHEDEGEAQQAVAKLKAQIAEVKLTVNSALTQYEKYMRDEKGNKENSVAQTMIRLRRFFSDAELGLVDLDEGTCAGYYEKLRTMPGKHGQPVSVDYHRNVLAESRSFLKWCLVKKKWIAVNPLDRVEGVGKRRHGKEQLRVDEARSWLDVAVQHADAEEPGAIAAMMTLLMGMRCSEVISRVARDVDDEGRLLWIPDSKTKAGRRTLQVPALLRPYLVALAEAKKPDELLFGYHDRAWPRSWVKRICEEADVPIVTAHGQRGLHSTLAVEAGITAHAVAQALGHESFKVTEQSYAKPVAVDRARAQRAWSVIDGGRARPKKTEGQTRAA